MYTLALGDHTYSSWSLRGWLLFEKFDIPVNLRKAHLYLQEFQDLMADFSPAKTVPALLIEGQNQAMWDSFAIAETLHERHPDAGLWPEDAHTRALARTLTAEMHSGFVTLRDQCTMNLEYSYKDFPVDDDLQRDLDRLEQIWAFALKSSNGPWLFGEYCVADAFFAPVASRVATYGLPVSDMAQSYVNQHLSDLSFRRWRAMGKAQNYVQPVYQLDFAKTEWPGPRPMNAIAVTSGTPKNSLCPYSQKPVQSDSLAEIEGQTVGFCNTFCRDKSVADPQAWPSLMEMLKSCN